MQDLAAHLEQLDKTALATALMGGEHLPPALRDILRGMPPDAVQMSTTGKTGARNILEAVDFCQAVMARYRHYCGSGQPAVLDFGCGWGRITRAFLTVTPPWRITGADVRPEAIEMARSLAPLIPFTLMDPRPPAPGFQDGAFDLVVGYSVFSHLSEAVAQAWINEFGRIVAPGGLVCITTRGRVHLLNAKGQAKNAANLSGHLKQYATMLEDFDAAIARYDAGGFVYVPTGGGGILTPDFFGEAIVPQKYVETHWQEHFELVEWVEKFSDIGTQPIIVLRRKAL